jgi:hypothetical protein
LGKLAIYMQKTETDPYPSPCAKINIKWVKDINVRPETLKLLQDKNNNKNPLEHTRIGNSFLN